MMTVDTALGFALVLALGMLVGALFLGGLWLTIRRGLRSRNPEKLFLISYVARVVLAAAAMLFIAQGDMHRLLLCSTGFILARIALAGYFRRYGVQP